MQEHTYVANRSLIIGQSLTIWLAVAAQIGLTIFGFSNFATHNKVTVLIFTNIVLGILSVPGVVLFLKYYKYSIGKKFIITYDVLKFIDEKTGAITEIKNTDIVKIYLFEQHSASKLPWADLEYFVIIDNKQNKIIITSFFMGISEFWLDSLTGKVSSDKLTRKVKMFPAF